MSGYLRKMWKTFLLFLSFCGILGLTFWLYGCSLEPVFYGAALCMIPAAGAFLYGWNRFRKEKEQLERIKALLPLELETLPKPEDERDELLQQIICRLNQMRMDCLLYTSYFVPVFMRWRSPSSMTRRQRQEEARSERETALKRSVPIISLRDV